MRGRIAGVGAGALALLAMLAALGAPAASAACPNEAFRTGPSAQLPECRAYEQVTPVDKESGIAFTEFGGATAGSSGGSLFFNAPSAFAGAQGNTLTNPYVATRVDDAWDVQGVGGPQLAQVGVIFHPALGISDDLRFALVASREALAPGAIPGGSNLYVRDNRTGAYTLVVAVPGEGAFNEFTGVFTPFVGAATDWSHVLIVSSLALTPDAVEQVGGNLNFYEFAEGRLRLAVAEAVPAVSRYGATSPNVMSADGSRFFYLKNFSLYMHREEGEPLLVSEDGEGAPLGSVAFVGATPGGDVAFFAEQYGEGALYRFEAAAAPGSRVTKITPPVGPGGEPPSVLRATMGDDGTTVYFAAKGYLTPDAGRRTAVEGGAEPGYDLYVWHGAPGQPGEIRYIGKNEDPRENDQYSLQLGALASPNGRYFGFESLGRFTPDAIDGSAATCPGEAGVPAGRCKNVFLYSYDTDKLACVSCDGMPPAGNSRLGGADNEARTYGPVANPVLDDGMVVFDSPNPLQTRDSNGALDAYAWRDGRAQLISTGTAPGESGIVGASPDGTDIFFQTEQSLVGQDDDSMVDVYDARVGGGLPQSGEGAATPCVGEAGCRGGTESSVPPAVPASGAVVGAGGVPAACLGSKRKARAARKRSQALVRRAKQAKAGRAKVLRDRAAREARTARRLGRRAGNCQGGAR